MAFNVQALTDYVNQNNKELLVKSVFGAKTAGLVNVQTGIKYKDALNILSVDPVLQERTCGWNESGDATFSQEYITVGAYKVNMSLCEEDLRKKWMNDEVKTAAGAEVLPFEEKITGELVANIDRQVEKLLWQADTASSDLFDGFLTIAKAKGTDVQSSASDVYGKVKDVYSAIPVEILDKAQIFVGIDTFRDLCQEMVTKNLYHYSADLNTGDLSLVFPGTDTKVIAVSGLNTTGAIIAANPEYLVMGVDMADDAEQFDVWYSKDHQEFRIAVKFNLGAQIAFADLVVYDI